MQTIETLREKLSKIISSGQNGIIALCGNTLQPTEDESFWKNHCALVYIQPLNTVAAFMPFGICYQQGVGDAVADCLFENFINREDNLTVEELGCDEQEYLAFCTECLLNDMAQCEGDSHKKYD